MVLRLGLEPRAERLERFAVGAKGLPQRFERVGLFDGEARVLSRFHRVFYRAEAIHLQAPLSVRPHLEWIQPTRRRPLLRRQPTALRAVKHARSVLSLQGQAP